MSAPAPEHIRKAIEFARDADAAARAAWPDGEAVRLSSAGFVAISVRVVVPVNVAAALEWHDDDNEAVDLSRFVADCFETGLESELTDGLTMPPAAAALFRLPADERTREPFDRSAAVPLCEAELSAPSDIEVGKATSALARHFAPPSPEAVAEAARIVARIMEDERKAKVARMPA